MRSGSDIEATELDVLIGNEPSNPLFTQSIASSTCSESPKSQFILPTLASLPYTHQATPSNASHSICPLCNVSKPTSETLLLLGLKHKLVRSIKRSYPYVALTPESRVCKTDLHAVLRGRVEGLIEEDSLMYAKLQDNTMKDLESYELKEITWQDQFDTRRTLGERAADNVAKFGGSWKFVLSLLLNVMLVDSGKGWDPYPFIALNLVLSMIAAFQGQKDRLVNDFISTIILRAENQTRHVNAKMDHLQSVQWKRLLEIQEIQGDVLTILQGQSGLKIENVVTLSQQVPVNPLRALIPAAPTLQEVSERTPWTTDIFPDDHARAILRAHFNRNRGMLDEFIFAHWHTDGDNFTGQIVDAQLVWVDGGKNGEVLMQAMVYTLELSDASATMDDLFSGDKTITLRNDFEVDVMHQHGRIASIELTLNKKKLVYQNGDLPDRYKPSFALKRSDRICEFWKLPLESVKISYIAPHQLVQVRSNNFRYKSKISVERGRRIVDIKAEIYPVGSASLFTIYARRVSSTHSQETLLNNLQQISTNHPMHEWQVLQQGQIDQNSATRTNAYFHDSVSCTVDIAGVFDEGVYLLYCLDCRIVFRGVIEGV